VFLIPVDAAKNRLPFHLQSNDNSSFCTIFLFTDPNIIKIQNMSGTRILNMISERFDCRFDGLWASPGPRQHDEEEIVIDPVQAVSFIVVPM
jgi:hypothetical protein